MSQTATLPTSAQIRGHFALTGSPVKGKVTATQIADFLYAYPATTRELSESLGVPMGSRGRLSPVGVGAVVSAIQDSEA